jgi:hypothetical protein
LLSLSVTFFPFRISVMRLAQHNHVVEAPRRILPFDEVSH